MYITVKDKEKWGAAWENPTIVDYISDEIVNNQSIIKIKFNRVLRKGTYLATHLLDNPPLLICGEEDGWNLCRFSTGDKSFKSEIRGWINVPVLIRDLGNWIYEEGIASVNSGITYG